MLAFVRGLGTFGPAGVLESARGHGHGRQLLLACLADLRSLGFERAIIPWTDAIDFYRKSCGAEPARRFVILSRGDGEGSRRRDPSASLRSASG